MTGEPVVARDRKHDALRHQLLRQMRDVDPALRRKAILVTHTSAECDDDDGAFGLFRPSRFLRQHASWQPPIGEDAGQDAKRITAPQNGSHFRQLLHYTRS